MRKREGHQRHKNANVYLFEWNRRQRGKLSLVAGILLNFETEMNYFTKLFELFTSFIRSADTMVCSGDSPS
jgi:hypothetical protein